MYDRVSDEVRGCTEGEGSTESERLEAVAVNIGGRMGQASV